LRTGIHDLSILSIGSERVMIFGGHTNNEPSKDIQFIDLSMECFKSRKGKMLLKKGGKSYFPPILDFNTGKVKVVFGYCDEKPSLEEVDISDLLLN
jgi:hypothetical protein